MVAGYFPPISWRETCQILSLSNQFLSSLNTVFDNAMASGFVNSVLQCAVVQVIIILVAEYLISLGTGVILIYCEDLYLHEIFISFLCYMLHNILIFVFPLSTNEVNYTLVD